MTHADFMKVLQPGMRVFVQAGSGEPSTLLAALGAGATDASRDVEFVSVMVAGVNRFVPTDFHARARFTTFFVYGRIGDAVRDGRARFLPLGYSSIHRYLERLPDIDVALIQVAPPDAEDGCSLGLSVDFVPAILARARTVVAEINRRMPAPPGSPKVPYARIDYAVECDHELAELADGPLPAETDRIAGHVAGLIDDGSTLQIGIGKLPDALLGKLTDRRGLGLHTGIITPGVRALIDCGALTGESKTIDRGRHVTGVAIGPRSFYEWAGAHPDLLFKPVSYTHDVRVIAQLDRFVSINSALQVDLFGQANSEMLHGRQVSGTGGLVDFARGARLSRAGRSIVILPSTAANGSISRILPRLDEPVCTVSRADIDCVATEHGVAELADKSVHERARALVDIAAPAFRDGLWESWEAAQREQRRRR